MICFCPSCTFLDNQSDLRLIASQDEQLEHFNLNSRFSNDAQLLKGEER